jgi:hypothetical protein
MEFAFTWSQRVALDLCCLWGDPSLVIWFMSFYKNYLLEDSRKFHQSLRVTSDKRWRISRALCEQKRFSEMNSSVPIAFPLPFDGDRWRKYTKLINSIRYFRENFIQTVINYYGVFSTPSIRDVTKIVNLILDDKYCGTVFRNDYSTCDIRCALEDYILFTSDEDVYKYEPLPTLCVNMWEKPRRRRQDPRIYVYRLQSIEN